MLNRVQNDDREIIYIFGYPRNGTKFAQFIFSEAINAPALTWSKKQDIVGDVRGLHRGGI